MTVTLSQVREIAADLLDQYSPDYIYQPVDKDPGVLSSCRYYHKGAPSCFVGRVFDRLGDPALIEAAKWADQNGAFSAGQTIERAGADFETEARLYLDTVQEYQDQGDTWGVAVWMAEHAVGLHVTYVEGCLSCDADEEPFRDFENPVVDTRKEERE